MWRACSNGGPLRALREIGRLLTACGTSSRSSASRWRTRGTANAGAEARRRSVPDEPRKAGGGGRPERRRHRSDGKADRPRDGRSPKRAGGPGRGGVGGGRPPKASGRPDGPRWSAERPDERARGPHDRGGRPGFGFGGTEAEPSDRPPRPVPREGVPRRFPGEGAPRRFQPGRPRRPDLGVTESFVPARPDLGELLRKDEELVAGRRPVEEAFVAHREAVRLLVVPQRREALEKLVLHATSLRIPIVEVEGGTLTALAGFDGHQGIGLVVPPRRYATPEEILARAADRGEAPFVLALDSLEDPHNVGSLLRTAEAAGVHGAIFPMHRQAPLTPAAVK